ncbi:DoxX family protein [Paenibacillus arenilitoris]|uniref:DoxX family protein n=1 Tax=Paenibacillus arenilitoris TaxID=2772299 RepID=A0A927CR09_9BACL|nr:DoxX family protein [Paenibacillus arenilitoris]MBD2870341.1 DoxX family protein [Paenibacillus arenilitoris]
MKKVNVLYWVSTVLLSVFLGMGAVSDAMKAPDAVALFGQLGYPEYLLPFLGIAKLLGVAAILIPGFPRIKEWAYAGLTFDLAGAMYSTLAAGGPVSGALFFVAVFAVLFGSYALYHKRRNAASRSLADQSGELAGSKAQPRATA